MALRRAEEARAEAPRREVERTPASHPEGRWARQSDEKLMTVFVKRGDATAFEELMRRHKGPVYRFILRFVGDQATAEDLIQEVFLRVVTKAETFSRRSKFTTWLYTIARNLCIDESRKRKHRRHPSYDEPEGDPDGRPISERIADPAPQADPHQFAKDLRLHGALGEALQKLPEDQREVFLLREYVGLRFHEIAELCEAPLGTVKSRMRYALQSLREELSAQGLSPEE